MTFCVVIIYHSNHSRKVSEDDVLVPHRVISKYGQSMAIWPVFSQQADRSELRCNALGVQFMNYLILL